MLDVDRICKKGQVAAPFFVFRALKIFIHIRQCNDLSFCKIYLICCKSSVNLVRSKRRTVQVQKNVLQAISHCVSCQLSSCYPCKSRRIAHHSFTYLKVAFYFSEMDFFTFKLANKYTENIHYKTTRIALGRLNRLIKCWRSLGWCCKYFVTVKRNRTAIEDRR